MSGRTRRSIAPSSNRRHGLRTRPTLRGLALRYAVLLVRSGIQSTGHSLGRRDESEFALTTVARSAYGSAVHFATGPARSEQGHSLCGQNWTRAFHFLHPTGCHQLQRAYGR